MPRSARRYSRKAVTSSSRSERVGMSNARERWVASAMKKSNADDAEDADFHGPHKNDLGLIRANPRKSASSAFGLFSSFVAPNGRGQSEVTSWRIADRNCTTARAR